MRGSLNQEIRAENATDETRNQQGNKNSPRHIELASISAAAGCGARPERHRIRGVGWNGWNTDEEQCGKGDKAAATGDGIERTAHHAGGKEKNGYRDSQDLGFITRGNRGAGATPAKTPYIASNSFTVRSLFTLPVFSVPFGSMRTMCVSSSAMGKCSTPRGTIKNSPGRISTSRSRSFMINLPFATMNNSSSFS